MDDEKMIIDIVKQMHKESGCKPPPQSKNSFGQRLRA